MTRATSHIDDAVAAWQDTGDARHLQQAIDGLNSLLWRTCVRLGITPEHMQDAVQDGRVGLVRASRTWDRGVAGFATYGMTSAMREILRGRDDRHIWGRSRIRYQTEIYPYATDLRVRLGREPTYEEIAEAMAPGGKASRGRVRSVRAALDAPAVSGLYASESSADILTADPHSPDPARVAAMREIVQLNGFGLTPREKKVLRMRFLQGKILEDVGRALGITKDRVRQIEVEAIEKLRARLGVEVAA